MKSINQHYATGDKKSKEALSSLVKISGQRRARDADADGELDTILAAQRSQNWNDMPYAALQLIADYHCVKASDALLDVGCVCKRWHDAAVNYLPADAWRRFYDHLVKVHYQIPEWRIAEAKLPTPDTLQAYSDAARYWQPFIDGARALRETFRGVEKMPDSWKMNALGTVAEWRGVKVESGRVTELRLHYESLRGTVDLTKLPVGLQKIWLDNNQLSGSVDLLRLPAGLQVLHLNSNQFSGSADLLRLPAGLRELCLYNNKLNGSVDMTQLPPGLQCLNLDDNQFSGAVDLTQLPPGMEFLALNANQFSGSIDLTQLPVRLRQLYLCGNQLSGSVDLSKLPASLQQLGLNENQLSGSVDLTRLPASLVHLGMNDNQFSGSVDLTRLPETLLGLNLKDNKFRGSIDLTQLPGKMQVLWLHNNKFEGSTSVNIKECEVKVDDTVEIKK